jgi:hypothetical protein
MAQTNNIDDRRPAPDLKTNSFASGDHEGFSLILFAGTAIFLLLMVA